MHWTFPLQNIKISVVDATRDEVSGIRCTNKTSYTSVPAPANAFIRGAEWLITLLHKFDSYESEDSAQKRCA